MSGLDTSKKALLAKITETLDLPAVLAYSPLWRKENFRYLTGVNFFGPFAMALYLRDSAKTYVLTSSPWDETRARQALPGVEVLYGRDVSALVTILGDAGIKMVGVSGNGVFPAAFAKALHDGGVETRAAEGAIEKARLIKTPAEVEKLRAAVSLADRAYPVFLEAIGRGLNEFEIMGEVEYALKQMGAEDNFMLVSTGGTEVFGMTPPMNRTAKPGDMILTELTPQLDGWWCQICRTAIKGEPSAEQRRIFDIFYESVEAGYQAIRPGVNVDDVAKAENNVFAKYGYGEYTTSQYTRVRGHGQGMHLDEAPTINEGVNLTLEAGMVLVVHPNTYNPATGYMVFGDPVVITEDGCEILSTTERKLFQV